MCIGGQCLRRCEKAGRVRPKACRRRTFTGLTLSSLTPGTTVASSEDTIVEVKSRVDPDAPISLREILEWTARAAA